MTRRTIWTCIVAVVAVLLAGACCLEPVRVEIRILPEAVELPPGGIVLFIAEVRGDRDVRVTWSTTGGDFVVGDRVHSRVYVEYTAPLEEGTFEVRATSVLQPTSFAVAEVVVSTQP